MNRPMGGWLLSYNVTMPDRPTARPFLRLSPANEKKCPSWLNTRIDLKSPLMPVLLFGHFSSLWNSFMWKESALVFMKFQTTIHSFIYACLATVRSVLRRALPRLLIAARIYLAFMWQNPHKNTQSSEWGNQTLGSFTAEDGRRDPVRRGELYPITDSNEVKCSLADRGTRQWNGRVQSCSEAPVIQPSVLIKTLCTRSIPVDNRLHSLVEARGVYQRPGERGQIRDSVSARGQCAYQGQVEWFNGVSSRTPPGPRKWKDHRYTHKHSGNTFKRALPVLFPARHHKKPDTGVFLCDTNFQSLKLHNSTSVPSVSYSNDSMCGE